MKYFITLVTVAVCSVQAFATSYKNNVHNTNQLIGTPLLLVSRVYLVYEENVKSLNINTENAESVLKVFHSDDVPSFNKANKTNVGRWLNDFLSPNQYSTERRDSKEAVVMEAVIFTTVLFEQLQETPANGSQYPGLKGTLSRPRILASAPAMNVYIAQELTFGDSGSLFDTLGLIYPDSSPFETSSDHFKEGEPLRYSSVSTLLQQRGKSFSPLRNMDINTVSRINSMLGAIIDESSTIYSRIDNMVFTSESKIFGGSYYGGGAAMGYTCSDYDLKQDGSGRVTQLDCKKIQHNLGETSVKNYVSAWAKAMKVPSAALSHETTPSFFRK